MTFLVDGRSSHRQSFPSTLCLCPVRGSVPRNGPQKTGSQASRKVIQYLIMPSEFFQHAHIQDQSLKNACGGSLKERLRGATPRRALHGVVRRWSPKRSPKLLSRSNTQKKRFRRTATRVTLQDKLHRKGPVKKHPQRTPRSQLWEAFGG
jgi:hypothetical protein